MLDTLPRAQRDYLDPPHKTEVAASVDRDSLAGLKCFFYSMGCMTVIRSFAIPTIANGGMPTGAAGSDDEVEDVSSPPTPQTTTNTNLLPTAAQIVPLETAQRLCT